MLFGLLLALPVAWSHAPGQATTDTVRSAVVNDMRTLVAEAKGPQIKPRFIPLPPGAANAALCRLGSAEGSEWPGSVPCRSLGSPRGTAHDDIRRHWALPAAAACGVGDSGHLLPSHPFPSALFLPPAEKPAVPTDAARIRFAAAGFIAPGYSDDASVSDFRIRTPDSSLLLPNSWLSPAAAECELRLALAEKMILDSESLPLPALPDTETQDGTSPQEKATRKQVTTAH